MNLIQKLEKVLQTEVIELKETSYGITNKNYIVKTENKTYFCRIPRDTFIIKNKENEREALEILAEQPYFLKPVYYDANLLITEFQENSKTFISNKNLSSIIEISKILKDFHAKKFQSTSRFNPVETFERYYYQVEQFSTNIENYTELIEKFSKLYSPDRLCHNDLQEGNFLFAKSHIYLIDYEYAGMNDYYFDIASFISENDLNYQETVTFLKSYFTDEKCDFEKLSTFLQFSDLLWYTWAWLSFERTKEEVYKSIADKKLETLKKPRVLVY